MASGPYGNKGENLYIIWSDYALHPEKPQLRETLKTKEPQVAEKRKHRLEELYEKGKHKPWDRRWYNNPAIKPFVTESLLVGNANDIRNIVDGIHVGYAIEQYISYQINRPKGWTTETSQRVYSDDMRKYGRIIGESRHISSITQEDLYKVLSRGPLSDETINSDRTKLTGWLNYCYKQKWIDEVPEMETADAQSKVPVFIYDEEFLQLCWAKIQKIESDIEAEYTKPADTHLRFVLAWMVLIGTGMRPSEACSVRLSDIHGDQILVNAHQKGKTNEQRMVTLFYEAKSAVSILADPKFRNMDRALARSDKLLGIESQKVMKRMSSELKDTWLSLFPDKPKRTAYHLRDTFAVRFLSDDQQENADYRMFQLSGLLGHSKITTTQKYLKAVPYRLQLHMPRDTDLCNILGIKTG